MIQKNIRRVIQFTRLESIFPNSERLVRSGLLLFIILVCGTGLTFFMQVTVAHLLGSDSYGIYIYVFSWMTILSRIASFGLNHTTVKYISAYTVNNQWNLANGFFRWAVLFIFQISLLLIAIGLIITWIWPKPFNSPTNTVFSIGLFTIPFMAYVWKLQSCFRAWSRIALTKFFEAIFFPASVIIASLVCANFLKIDFNETSCMTITLMASIITCIYAFGMVKSSSPPETWSATPAFHKREWLAHCTPMLAIVITNTSLRYADILIIGAILDNQSVAFYAAASKTASLACFGLTAVNLIIAPKLSQLHSQNKVKLMETHLIQSSLIIIGLTLPLCFLLILFGQPILRLFGGGFGEAYWVMIILLIGQTVNAMAGSVSLVLSMTGRQMQASFIIGAGALANILLNFLFIPYWGTTGAAWASTITCTGWNLAMILYIINQMKIHPVFWTLPLMSLKPSKSNED